MVNELHNQRVISRGHAHITTLRRLRKKSVSGTIRPFVRSGLKIDTSSDGDVDHSVAFYRMQGLISFYHNTKVLLSALWHRLCILCGRLRPTVVLAIGAVASLGVSASIGTLNA